MATVVTTVKDFNSTLAPFKKQVRDAARLAAKAGSLKTGQKLIYQTPAGTVIIGVREALSIHSAAVNRLLKAASDMFSGLKKSKKGKKRTGNQGFRFPFIVGPELVNFFSNGNLGPAQPSVVGSSPLKSYLSFIGADNPANATYVVTQAILTPLFAIYAHVNNLASLSTHNKGTPNKLNWNGQWLGADTTMKEYLKNTLTTVTAESLSPTKEARRAERRAKVDAQIAVETSKYNQLVVEAQAAAVQGKTTDKLEKEATKKQAKIASLKRQRADIKPFDENDFQYFDFQSLVKANRLTPETAVTAGVPSATAANAATLVARPEGYKEDIKRLVAAVDTQLKAGVGVDASAIATQLFGGQIKPQVALFARLYQEQIVVSNALNYYRQQREAEKKALLAQRKAGL